MLSMFRTIKAKLLIVITILVLVPCLFLTIYAYRSRISIFNESVDQTLSAAQQALGNAQLAMISKGLNFGHFFMQDSGLRDAVFYNTMTGDNSNLLTSLVGYYESLDLNNIEFTSRDGVVQGRGHKPEKFGDSKLDFPFTRTMLESRKASWDMEIGKNGVTLKFGSPVFSGDEFLGFVGYGYFIDQAFLESIKKVINAELFYILKKDSQLIASTRGDIEVADFDGDRLNNSLAGVNELEREREIASGYHAVGYIPVLDFSGDVFAVMIVMKDISSEVAARNASLTFSILILAAFIILGIVAAIFISVKLVAAPLSRVSAIMENIANGDLTSEIDVNRHDELGLLLKSMKLMQEKLTDTLRSIIVTAQQVSSASQSISGSTGGMSQGATQQATASEEASSSMEEMSSNIRQNADNAQSTEKIALKAAEGAREGGEAVTITVSAMNEIADKITIVEEIARQTNMLALNAAIEAARAGEHGKGFAVVAAEVRKLAERSQTAAREISELSGSSVEVAQNAGQILERMLPDIGQTAELVQEITAASNEQKLGAEQINNAFQQLDQVTQLNASAAEELSSTAEELAGQAEQLLQTIAYFSVNGAHMAWEEKPGSGGHRRDQQPTGELVASDPTAHALHLKAYGGGNQDGNGEGVRFDMDEQVSDEDVEEPVLTRN